jgi:hypothetical protein
VLPVLWFCYALVEPHVYWGGNGSDSRLSSLIVFLAYWLYYPIFAVVIKNFWFFFFHSEFWVYSWVVLGGTGWSYVLSFGTRFIFRKIKHRLNTSPRISDATAH